MFQAKIGLRVVDILDGASNTAMLSESTLGEGDESSTKPPADPQTAYVYVSMGTPISDSACAGASSWNISNRRGFMWASGELRCGSYNHWLPPNSPMSDCVTNDMTPGEGQYTAVGFRAARSRHIGGVNLLLGDGSARFVSSSIQPDTWRKIGTRAGKDIVSDSNF
jgi:hypothetical protein